MTETPLGKRLRLKPRMRLRLVNAPEGYLAQLAPLPAGARVVGREAGPVEFVQVFANDRAELERLAPTRSQGPPGRLLWVSYPRLSSPAAGDLSREIVWQTLAPRGLRPVAQIAVDQTWSALRFRLVRA